MIGTVNVFTAALPLHEAAIIAIGAAMTVSFLRLIRGPSLADRVVALDLMAFFATGIVAVAAVTSGRRELIMVAVVVALLSFMGTSAFALYLERRGRSGGV